MPQILALWRDTKWLWLLFAVLIAAIAVAVEPLVLLVVPVLPFMYGYFAFLRYDRGGEPKDKG